VYVVEILEITLTMWDVFREPQQENIKRTGAQSSSKKSTKMKVLPYKKASSRWMLGGGGWRRFNK